MEEEYDKTKYFFNSSKNKIYTRKGQLHEQLARNIIQSAGLNDIYKQYEDDFLTSEFLTYCGYVWVDEPRRNMRRRIFYCNLLFSCIE